MEINKALMMSEREYIKDQQSIIDDFYKEHFTYDISNIGCWIVAGLFGFVQIIFSAVPVQQMLKEGGDDEFLGILAFLTIFPVFFYLEPFIIGQERYGAGNGRVKRLYSVIKYLPVSVKALRKYRFKKMLGFALKLLLICSILQIGISLLVFHRITWQNLAFLSIYDFLLPVAVGAAKVYFNK